MLINDFILTSILLSFYEKGTKISLLIEVWYLKKRPRLQAIVITITFWKESSFSECEEINDHKRAVSGLGQRQSSEGGLFLLGNPVPRVWER